MTRRIRIHIGVGDVLETTGAVIACVAVGHLAGLWWALLLAAVLLVVAGNLIYGQRFVTVGLPNRDDLAKARFRAVRPARMLRDRVHALAITLAARARR